MKKITNDKEIILITGLLACGLSLFGIAGHRIHSRVKTFENSITSAHAEKQILLDQSYNTIIKMTGAVPATVPTLKHVLAEALQQKNVREKAVVNYLMAVKIKIHPGLYGEVLRYVRIQKPKMLSSSNALDSKIHRYRLYLNSSVNGKILKLFGYPKIKIESFERPLMWPDSIPYQKVKEYNSRN